MGWNLKDERLGAAVSCFLPLLFLSPKGVRSRLSCLIPSCLHLRSAGIKDGCHHRSASKVN